MRKLFTLIIGSKKYITTNDAVAWDVCMRFNAEIQSIGQTNRVIDGLEYQERTGEEIFESIKRLCAPFIKGFKGPQTNGNEEHN